MTILITPDGYKLVSGNPPKEGERYECKPVSKRRSTGYRSQNSHTHGHYADIAEQLSFDGVTVSADTVGRLLKIEAMKAGEWPAERDSQGRARVNPISKQLEPLSEADATSAEAARLLNFIHWLADQRGWWLTEYVDGRPQRVYGAKPEELEIW